MADCDYTEEEREREEGGREREGERERGGRQERRERGEIIMIIVDGTYSLYATKCVCIQLYIYSVCVYVCLYIDIYRHNYNQE